MIVYYLAAVLLAIVLLNFVWRWASRRWSLPCPSLLSWMVDGPIADALAGTGRTLDQLRLKPGMTIVEIGPGPGRLLVPAARRILPDGKAIGVEVQQGMIDKLKGKLASDDPGNVLVLHADATHRVLPSATADLVYLCTVLGEIPDRGKALENCFDALRPGGRLAITEIIGDPHYQSRTKVRQLAEQVGFQFEGLHGSWRMYTATFRRPEEKAAA
jgi:ubiquinone/menaquinone biosynthesis C-methylase UbiE